MYNPSLRKIEALVEDYLKEKHLRAEEVGVKPLVLLAENRKFQNLLVDEINGQRSPDWLYDDAAPLYFAKLLGVEVSVVGALPPGPAFLTEIEVLRSLGARMFLGVFEGIGIGAGTGKLFLVDSVACFDWASYRYSGGRKEINASYRLSRFLKAIFEMEDIKAGEAKAASLETPYLILENDLDALRAASVTLISFHVPSLYAFSFYSGCETTAVVVTKEDLYLKPKISADEIYSTLAAFLAKHLQETAFV
ncbi:MAG: hypothetical protein QXJ27_05335 [Thermoplasmata archaeon]